MGVRGLLLAGVGLVAWETVDLGPRFAPGAGFGSAVVRSTLGSGLGAGLSLTSAGLDTSSVAFSGCSGVVLVSGAGGALDSAAGLSFISVAGGALGCDSGAASGLELVSAAIEIVTGADSEI